MLWICTGCIAVGLLLYWLFAPREEEVILLGNHDHFAADGSATWEN